MPVPRIEPRDAKHAAKLAAQDRWRQKKRHERNDQQRERRFRHRRKKPITVTDDPYVLHIVNAEELDRPAIAYMDMRGHLHFDDYRSAEELIRDWKREQRKEAAQMKSRKQQGKKLHKELDPGRREMRRAQREAAGKPTRRSPSPLDRERVENP